MHRSGSEEETKTSFTAKATHVSTTRSSIQEDVFTSATFRLHPSKWYGGGILFQVLTLFFPRLTDKEVLLRMHNAGSDPSSVDAPVPKSFYEKARRRQSMPSSVLEEQLATFRQNGML